MRNRISKDKYEYGPALNKESKLFREDIYRRIGIGKIFRNKKVLDLGCGFGADSALLAKFAKEVYAIDIEKYREWNVFKSNKIKFRVGESSKLPFADNTFDGVYLKDLLHHVKAVSESLSEIKRVTKPGGEIVILEGNRYNPFFYIYATKIQGHDHFTQKEFKKIITDKFPAVRFIALEAYPPLRFPMQFFKLILKIEKAMNKLNFLSPFFAYNICIIKNIKNPKTKR